MVVKKSYLKIIWREFKSSFGRFAAIFGIVALGVGFLSGLLVTTPDMHYSVDEYYDKYNMADIFIKATMGLTEDDLEEVRKIPNVKDIMPARVIDTLVDINSKTTIVAKVYGIPLLDIEEEKSVNRLELIEGRMPKNTRECLVERKSPFLSDVKIGSKIKLSRDNKDYDDIGDIFEEKKYTVVGIVGNSFHFSLEREISNVGSGKLGTIIYVDSDSYALEDYTDFYIVAEDTLEMNTFATEYEDYIEKITADLEKIADKRSVIRKREILDEANEELQEGYEEYNDGKDKADRELEQGAREISEGKKELKAGFLDLKDGEKELKNARKTLRKENKKAKKEIELGKRELESARLDLIQGQKELKTAKNQLEMGEKSYKEGYRDYKEGQIDLKEGILELSKAEEELIKGEREVLQGKEDLRKGIIESRRGKEELEKGQAEYEKGILELKKGKRDFLEGISEIADNFPGFSPEDLVSTSQGRNLLKSYLVGANQELTNGLAQAKAGEIQLLSGMELAEQKKEELNNRLKELTLQLELIEENPTIPEEEKENLRNNIQNKIQLVNNGLMEVDKELEKLNVKLIELENTIVYLEQQQQGLPSYDFLISTWNEIQRNEYKLNEAKESLTRGFRDYNSGLEQLKEAELELKQAEKDIAVGKGEVEKNRKILESGKLEAEKGLRELENAKEDLGKGRKEYEKGFIEIRQGWKEYDKGLAEIKQGKNILEKETENALETIKNGEEDIEKGLKELEKAKVELEKAEKDFNRIRVEVAEELNEAYEELKEAEDEIRDLDDPEWYVLDRDSNMGYVSFVLNSEKVRDIANVFPIFFYLVAGLVALTTMTRMVEEERTQIGVLKALGYKRTTIIFKYILYCGLASILGSIAGQLVGFKVIPLVIWNAYGVMYHLPKFVTDYNTKIALLSSGMAIISTVAATYFSASGALKEKPALLMLPRPPKKGKRIILERITPLWGIMSFNLKSTARNIFRYKKHFYMTVIGVSGCTALLVAGFGLRDSIKDVGNLQFDELFKYELEIQIEDDFSTNQINNLVEKQDEISEVLEVYSDTGYVISDDKKVETLLVAVDDIEDISDYILFRNRESGEIIEPSEDKIIISEKAAEVLNLKLGDTFFYENSDEKRKEFIIDGITENYIRNYLYMEKDVYEKAFKKDLDNNKLFTITKDLNQLQEDKLIKDLYENEGVISAEFISQSRGMFDNLIESINYIVLVIIVASGLLAFIVLYNLTNININERRRELATLKVLGFHNEEVSAYIFREISILAFIGTMVGLLLGKYLHLFIVVTVEDAGFMFGRDIRIISYIISAFITLIFSGIVDLFMAKKLRNIKMVDSLKAND